MRISDWSSDVCSSDLIGERAAIVDLRDQIFKLGVIARNCEIAAPDRTALDADFVRRAVFVDEQHLYRARRARLGETRVEPAGARERKSVMDGARVLSVVDIGGSRNYINIKVQETSNNHER